MENNYVIAFLFISNYLCAGAAAIQCSRGERVDTLREGGEACVPCEDFAFMAEGNHSYTTCKTCTFIEDPDVEVFVSLCNRTHDSVILCKSGFYRRGARNVRQKDSCEKCTECENPTRACEGYYDTVCCHDNQEAVLNSHGVYVCRKRPIVCGPGQFFITSTEECLPCPDGTFMSAHSHTYKECLKCEQFSENKATHAVIVRPCSRTAPTLFGCKNGYFRDPTQESLQTEVPCTPCRSCQLSLTECGMFHDAECDTKGKPDAIDSSLSGNEHEKAPLEISVEKGNETSGAVENTSQSTQNKSELPSCIECSDTGAVWIYYLILVILLLLSNLILSLILFPMRQINLKAGHVYDNLGNHLFCFTRPVNKMRLFTMISIAALVVFQILAAVGKQYAIELVITNMILSILVVIVNVFIHCKYLFCSNKKRKHLPDVVKTPLDNNNFVSENKQKKSLIDEPGNILTNEPGNKQCDVYQEQRSRFE